jgi:glyoxylase-like metal-dependent hydrolase (beta-lactamase superfamily II)
VVGDDEYEVFAVRYARVERRSSENFLGGDVPDVAMPMDYFVWVLRGRRGTVLIDTGFDQAQAVRRGRQLLHPVDEGLAAIGVDHAEVADIVITHMHYDHSGNTHLFPNARFHVQDLEMRYATGRLMRHAAVAAAYDPAGVATMVRRVFEGRVVFHDGTAQLSPGISVHHLGGHTMGLQAVRVNTRRGHVLLISDAAHFYANFEQRRVFPVQYNVPEVVESYLRAEQLASSLAHIVPGHDPRVRQRYPPPDEHLSGWVVRLDAEPSDTEPSDTEPSDTEPSDTEPSDTEPSDAEPSDAEPSDAEPSDAEPPDSRGEDS